MDSTEFVSEYGRISVGRVIILLLTMVLSGASYSQATFSTIHSPGNNEPNLIIQDSSYVVLQQGNPEVDQLHKIYFDNQGNYQRTDSIQLLAFYEDCKGCLSEIQGGYIKAGTYFYSNDSAEVIIIKFNKNLDTVKTIAYSYNGDQTSDAMGLYLNNDNKVFLLGEYLLKTTSNYSGLLVCLDTNLNVLWERKYSLANLNSKGGLRITNAVDTQDKGLMLGGYYLRRNPYLLRGLIIKVDSLGNEEWRQLLDGVVQNDEVFLRTLINNNVLFVCSTSDSTAIVSGNAFSRLRVGEIDLSGTVLWEKHVGSPSLFMDVYYFKQTLDSNFIIGGYGSNYNFSSFIQKVNANGDSLWFRTVSFADSLSNAGHLQEALETKDQGLLLAGYYEDFGPSGTGVNTWLVKTDSLGCVQIDCQSIGRTELGVTEDLISVYPNPSSDLVFVKSDVEKFSFQIFDLAGKRYISGTSLNGMSQLDISDLKEGIYLIEILNNEGSHYQTFLVE